MQGSLEGKTVIVQGLGNVGYYAAKFLSQEDGAKIIGVIPPKDFMHQYTDRTRQKHRLFILTNTGFLPFNNKIDFFEESITDMVDKQMHPRKLFYD